MTDQHDGVRFSSLISLSRRLVRRSLDEGGSAQREGGSSLKRKTLRFTLIELLVVMAIIAILAGMLLPALSTSKDQAKGAFCLNNQKQVGTGFLQYVNTFNDYLFYKYSDRTYYTILSNSKCWKNQRNNTHGTGDIYAQGFYSIENASCPMTKGPADEDSSTGDMYYVYATQNSHPQYGSKADWRTTALNPKHNQTMYFLNLNAIQKKGEMKYAWGLADSRMSLANSARSAYSIGPEDNGRMFAARHNGKVNMWYFDGHATAETPQDVAKLYKYISGLTWCKIYTGKNGTGAWVRF